MKLIQPIRQTMNWDSVEEKWKRLIGSARENWSKLTDQDLEQISGKREPLISKIQESYGISRREGRQASVGLGKSVEHTRKTIA